MRFLFANHIMAAAFASAVAANHDNLNTDNVDGCCFADPDWRTVDLNPDGDTVYMENTSYMANVDRKVNTLAELQHAIGEALNITADADEDNGNTSVVLFRVDESDKNNPLGDYNIRIRADGTIRVGCKNFTRKGAEEVIAAAKLASQKKKVVTFRTHSGGDTNLEHSVRTSDYNNHTLIVGGDTVEADNILTLAKIRDRVLKDGKAKLKPEPKVVITPFQIFPSLPKRKVKAKTRERK